MTSAAAKRPPTRADVCVAAIADLVAGDGEILVSPFGTVPTLGARLARLTVAPDLVLTDGEAALMADTPPIGVAPAQLEAPMPYRRVFDVVWSGRRHVVMMASQLDRFGNQNLSAIGDHRQPTVALIGCRGAPGNSVHHPTSYWVPTHSPRVFVEAVDVVCGVGPSRATAAGVAARRYHDLRGVVTDLAVLDWSGPGRSLSLVSVHPGVVVDQVVAATGCTLHVPPEVPETRWPTPEELDLLRTVLDPGDLRSQEVPG
jgi:acyl CoA:acetate/3-ketoacid CoA transferase beta subunit